MDFSGAPIAKRIVAKRNFLNCVLFTLFFCSGFCSLLYQLVWLRLAFASFGIITPVLSVVISVFMLGLGVGSVVAGRDDQPYNEYYILRDRSELGRFLSRM